MTVKLMALTDVLIWPAALPYRIALKTGLKNLRGVMESAGRFRGRFGSALRVRLLRSAGASVGKSVFIGRECEFFLERPELLRLGSGIQIDSSCRFGETALTRHEVSIGDDCRICDGNRFGAYAGPIRIGSRCSLGFFGVYRGPLTIGDSVEVAHHCVIVGAGRDFEDTEKPLLEQGVRAAPVAIGDSVWIGSHVTVMPGVTIGEHSVIGANSVVTNDVPPYCVAVGAPARVIKRYDRDAKKWIRV